MDFLAAYRIAWSNSWVFNVIWSVLEARGTRYGSGLRWRRGWSIAVV